MSDQADDPAGEELYQYAFHMDPQLREDGDAWIASYPGSDWSVSGGSRDEALQRLGEEFVRRQNSGDDPLAYADDVYRRHLREPIDGIYAVDNELYRQLIDAAPDERERAVQEAERKRRSGERYTLSDYLRDREDRE